jgi:hypothetical protein
VLAIGQEASGLVLLPQGIVMGLSTKWGMGLSERGWLRPVVLLGLLAVGLTTTLLLLVDLHTPLWTVAVLMAGRGLGIGLVIQPLLLAMLAGLGTDQMADANTLFNVAQRLGASVGIGLLATFFTLRAGADGPLSGFHQTILVAAGVAFLGVFCALFIRPSHAAGPGARASDDMLSSVHTGSGVPTPDPV